MRRWLSALYVRRHDRHDPAWHPTGLTFVTPREYDEAKAIKGARRARTRTARGTKLPKPTPKAGSVIDFPRQREAK